MDLEARLAQVLENKDQGGGGGPSKRTNPDWLPNANSVKHVLTGHRMRVTAVAFHPVYSAIASASEDCTLKVWDWERGELEKTLTGHTRLITDCQYDSHGKNLGLSFHRLRSVIGGLSLHCSQSLRRMIFSSSCGA